MRRVEAAPEVDVSGRRLIAAERQAILTAKLNLERVSSLHAQVLRSTRDLELAERDMAKAEGEVVSELNLGEPIIGTPSIANGAVYFSSDGWLWLISKT